VPDYFEKNIEFIRTRFSALYQKLLAFTPRLEQSASGSPTLKLKGRYLESRYDPRRTTRKDLPSSFGDQDTALFLGCGLGYQLNELFRRGIRRAVLIEKEPLVFRAALHVIAPAVLHSVVPLVDETLHRVQETISLELVKPFALIKHSPSIRLNFEYYHSVEALLGKLLKERIASQETERFMQQLWEKNVLKNLLHGGERYYATKELKNAFSGPALLVASGPFLEEIALQLERLQNTIPVFALLPSLPYLLQHGVRPDLLLSTDAGFGNLYRFFRGVDIPLVSTLSAQPALLRNWHGKVLLFSHELPLEQDLSSVKECCMSIPMQGTSSSVMVQFARSLGFSPLYLAGFDFAYLGIRDHHPGAGFDTVYCAHAGRFRPWQTVVFQNFRKDVPVAGRATSGRKLYSTHKLKLYREWMDREVAGHDLFRINQGMGMEHVKLLSPHQLIPQLLTAHGTATRSIFQRTLGEKGDRWIPLSATRQDIVRVAERLGAEQTQHTPVQKLLHGLKKRCENGDSSCRR
jgi:hypothetical protein